MPVLPRLLAHVTGALILTWGAWPSWATHYPQALLLAVPLLLVVPAINFWNFIDGINGMAATQAAMVAAGLAALALVAGDTPASWFSALVVGALWGFLPANFPHARAFMGDVGSASLGLIIAALALQPVRGTGSVLPAALLLAAPVFLDTGHAQDRQVPSRGSQHRHRRRAHPYRVGFALRAASAANGRPFGLAGSRDRTFGVGELVTDLRRVRCATQVAQLAGGLDGRQRSGSPTAAPGVGSSRASRDSTAWR